MFGGWAGGHLHQAGHSQRSNYRREGHLSIALTKLIIRHTYDGKLSEPSTTKLTQQLHVPKIRSEGCTLPSGSVRN